MLAEERAKDAEDINLMRRDLESNIRRGICLTPDITAIVVLAGPNFNRLDGLGAKVLMWDLACVSELLNFRHVVWAAPTQAMQNNMVHGEDTEVCLASRMLGGFIAGPEWIDACVRANVLFEPVLRLAKAIQVPKELRVHESYNCKDSLEKMCIEAARNPSANMKWTLRESRKKLWPSSLQNQRFTV